MGRFSQFEALLLLMLQSMPVLDRYAMAQCRLPSPLLTWDADFFAVWGVTGASFILGLPLLNGVTAFSATTSIACAGLALTYSLPILLRILFRSNYLEAGPFTLGR